MQQYKCGFLIPSPVYRCPCQAIQKDLIGLEKTQLITGQTEITTYKHVRGPRLYIDCVYFRKAALIPLLRQEGF